MGWDTGRLNFPGNLVDQNRGSRAGVDGGVYLDDQYEREEGRGNSGRTQQYGGWGWGRGLDQGQKCGLSKRRACGGQNKNYEDNESSGGLGGIIVCD